MSLMVLSTFCVLVTGRAYAISLDEVHTMDVSSSGKSLVIDRGDLEGYKVGEKAKFFVQAGNMDFPKIFMIAEGRLVKNYPKSSIWFLEKVHAPQLILPEITMQVMLLSKALAGRHLVQSHKHIVVPEDEYSSAEDYKRKNENNVPDRLVVEKENHQESDDLFFIPKVHEVDQQVETYETYKNGSGQHMSDEYDDESSSKFFIGKKEVKMADFKKVEDKKLFDSLAQGLIKKVNSQRFGLTNGLYRNLKKTSAMRDINDQITVTSVYDQEKERAKEKEDIDPRAIAKMKRDGDLWSADMDDTTLRRYFIQTGLEAESRRRELVLNELEGNEVLFHYSGSLSDHTTGADPNYRNLGFNFSLSYDLHLARTNKDLKNWSLQFSLERGVADYDIGGDMNARGEDGHYGAYINYYFLNNPLTLNSLIVLAGAGIKTGTINMSNQDLSKQYTYQSLVLPSLQLLSKYRFRPGDLTEDTVNVGMSFNAGITYDIKRLSVVESLDDNINGKMNIKDLRYVLGLGIYF